MAIVVKNLGQVAPSATTDTALYTAPAATSAICSTITVNNTSASVSATYRIAVQLSADGSLGTKNYIVTDQPLSPKDTVTLSLGLTLGAGDSIRVYASTANIAFTASGVERS